MVCPVCGEVLEFEAVRPGEVLDCEACGATLKAALSSEVQALPEGGFESLEGLSAFGGEDLLLVFGEEEESVRVDRLVSAEVAAEEGVLLLRRIQFLGAPDLLEFTLPSGSVYEFPFRKALAYLRPFLRR